MLTTTILTESNKTGQNNIYTQIRGPNGFAIHQNVVQQIDIVANSDLKLKLLELLQLAAEICPAS